MKALKFKCLPANLISEKLVEQYVKSPKLFFTVYVFDGFNEVKDLFKQLEQAKRVSVMDGFYKPMPKNRRGEFGLIALHKGELNTETIIHEITHALLDYCSRNQIEITANYTNEILPYLMGGVVNFVIAMLHGNHYL